MSKATFRTAMSTAERLRDEISLRISSLGLVSGDQLPSEQELAEILGYSRSTVREALRLLEQEGMVRAVQGRGRFVSGLGALRVERPVTKYESITEMLEGLGYEVTSAVLDVQLREATQSEASALQLDEGDQVIEVMRLRFGDNIPLVFSINAVPAGYLPGPTTHRDWSGSLSRALEMQGHRVADSIARISATDIPEPYASRYDLAQFDPWILVTETCLSPDGTPLIYATDYHRGSEIAFNVLRRT